MKLPPFLVLAGAAFSISGGLMLLGCSSDVASSENSAVPAVLSPEPTVLATAQHYVRMMSQPAPPPVDSLLSYRHLPVEPSLLPGRFLLRLRTHTVVVQPDSPYSTVIIEPAERTSQYQVLSSTERPRAKNSGVKVQIDTTPRRSNPILAVQLPALVAAFGPWKGDFYIPVEEPLEPEMHPTEMRYLNPATQRKCRISVRLKNAPSAATNAVHEISIDRDDPN